MKNKITLFFAFLLMSIGLYSQNYRQAAGLRLGGAGGITYRRLFDSNLGGEEMLASQNHGTSLVFLFEKQRPAVLFDDLNLNFIYGAGAHFGGANFDNYYNNSHDNYYHRYNTLQLGVDGFASFEYLIPRYPVALSIETKPYFEFFDDHSFGLHLFVIAFGARYMF